MAMEDVYKRAINSLIKGDITKEDLLEVLNEQYTGYQNQIQEKKDIIINLKEKLNFLEKHLSEVHEKYKEKFKDD